mmetsp:Transcript_15941/g.28334  ORF Transcript_15941/g.28334 Transcript_15941/m.28334 type:complete len:486 (-) Transcript_15941:125-1582(-)
MFPGQKKLAPDHRILKIRAYEDKLATYQAHAKTELNMACKAEWETNTTAKLTKRMINNRFEELKAAREENLDARREALFHKLVAEERGLQEELMRMKPTADQRRAALADKARALAAKNEAYRLAEANRLMMKHFRENCDPVREQDSRKVLYQTVAEREKQLEEAAMLAEMERSESSMYHQMSEQERLKKEKRYQDDMRRVREANAATVHVLDDQMRRVQERREEEEAAREAEIRTLHERWGEEDRAAAAAEAARREAEAVRLREVKRFNQHKADMDAQKEEEEFQEDLKYVTMAMQKAAEDEARDREKKERRKQETMDFRRQLEVLAVKEAEDTSAQDAMIDEAARRQQAKHDAEQEAKEVARRKLMAEVLEERGMQLEERQMKAARDAEEARLVRERAEVENKALAEMEVEMKERDRVAKMQQRLDIQAQIWSKEQKAAADQEQKWKEAQSAHEAEARYLGIVKKVEDMPAREDYRRKKVEWYY